MRYRLLTSSQFTLGGFVAMILMGALCFVAGSSARAAQNEQPGKQSDEKAELADLLEDARHYAMRTTTPHVSLKLHEPPVFNFTNPERNQERGSVFVWLRDGRPAVIGQFFCFNKKDGRSKKHALHSLEQVPLEARFQDKLAWTPEQAGIAWRSFPEAPAVAPSRNQRLLQMRQLARPFQVTLSDPKEQTTELRLVPRPVFEYSAPQAGVTDGAIFLYVVGTDPEAILLVESFEEQKRTGFRYAFARFHFWKLTAQLTDRTVWEVEYDPSMSGNTFANPKTIKSIYNSFHP